MTLTNDVAELSGVVNLTSADVMLATHGRDCSFNGWGDVFPLKILVFPTIQNKNMTLFEKNGAQLCGCISFIFF